MTTPSEHLIEIQTTDQLYAEFLTPVAHGAAAADHRREHGCLRGHRSRRMGRSAEAGDVLLSLFVDGLHVGRRFQRHDTTQSPMNPRKHWTPLSANMGVPGSNPGSGMRGLPASAVDRRAAGLHADSNLIAERIS